MHFGNSQQHKDKQRVILYGKEKQIVFLLSKKQLESAEHHLLGKWDDRHGVTYQALPPHRYKPSSLKD